MAKYILTVVELAQAGSQKKDVLPYDIRTW